MKTIEIILNNIKFQAVEADVQKDLFTPYHTLFKCTIKYNKKQYTFNYQCNTKHTEPNTKDCLYALISDANCFNCSADVDEFLTEFGYIDTLQNIRKGEKAYKECEKTAKALTRLFTNTEIETLNNYFENY